MNWKLAVVAVVVILAVLNLAGGMLAQTLPGVTISGPSPWLDVKAYGAKGDGSTDDKPAIQAALDTCPDSGCTIYFPSSTGEYKINAGLTISGSKVGVKLLGECGGPGHSSGSAESCSRLASDQAITMLTVAPSSMMGQHSGLVIQDLGFQDLNGAGTGTGIVLGAIDLVKTQNFTLIDVHCRDIKIGYCMLFDGNNADVTQFGVVINPVTSNTRFPVKIVPQASEINFYGGDFNCGGLDAGGGLEASIGMDLRGTAGSNSGGEFSIFGTHTINCLTGISALETANLNYYGIMEQPIGDQKGDGIVIDGSVHASKNTIAGSIDGFTCGVRLLGTNTSDNRVLASITATATPIDASPTLLRTAFILTPRNYGGSGAAVGTQIPTDVTIPNETKPTAPASGSRRVYVDSNNGDDLTSERTDGSTADLESILLNYQKPTGTSITGTNQTVYTFSVPSIPDGRGIRARVFWQCTSCSGASKTFTWQFGTATLAYNAVTASGTNLAYTEIRIFNDPNSHTSNTMISDAITVGGNITVPGNISIIGQDASGALSLTFLYTGTPDTIAPKAFIVERL